VCLQVGKGQGEAGEATGGKWREKEKGKVQRKFLLQIFNSVSPLDVAHLQDLTDTKYVDDCNHD